MNTNDKTKNSTAAIKLSTLPRNVYFAYGSNMDLEQMMDRCPNAQLMGKATLRGFGLASDTSGYATVVEGLASAVTGVLWAVSDEDIKSLDRYEGVRSNCYRKEIMTVVRPDAIPEEIRALVYVSNRAPFLFDSGNIDYFKRVLAAAELVDCSPKTLGQLERIIEASELSALPDSEVKTTYHIY